MKRRKFIRLIGGIAAWPLAAKAQQARNLPIMGFLHPGFPGLINPTIEGLREGGYVDGETIKIEARYGLGKPEALAAFAEELVRLKVDVIVAVAPPSVWAAKAATKDLPIVALDLESDPIANGFVKSWAAPGGNITGLFLDLPGLTGKWLQLIRQVLPDARRIAVLWDTNTGESQLRPISAAAKEMAIDLQILEFRDAAGMESVLTKGLQERPQALVALGSPLINQLASRVAELLAQHGVPGISPFRSFPDSGGTMSYGPNLTVMYRRVGPYVSRILKGANAADLAVEQATNFELIVNAKTTKALGIEIPPALLTQADKIIE